MPVAFYNSVTDKVAMERLGVYASDFEALVEDGHLLVSSLNTNKRFVDTVSLEAYIKKYGGKEARYKENVAKKLFEVSIKEISRVKREIGSINKSNKENTKNIQSNLLYYYTIQNSFNNLLTNIIEGTSRDIEVIAHKTVSDILGSSLPKLHQLSEYKKIPYTKDEIADIDKFMKTIKLFRKNAKTLKELHSLGLEDNQLNDCYESDELDLDNLFADTSIKLDTDTRDLYSNFFQTYRSTLKAYESIDYKLSDSVKQDIIAKCEKQYNKSIDKYIF